jgi:hypothetical protein
MLSGETVAVYCENRTEHTDTCKLSPYFTGNTSRHHYRAQPVNAVWGNSRCLLWDPYGTQRYSVWAECRVLVHKSLWYVRSLAVMTPEHLRRLVTGFPLRRLGFEPRPGYAAFAMNKQHWDKFSPSTTVPPPPRHLRHTLLHAHHQSSSGADTIGQFVAALPSGLSLTPPQDKTRNKNNH